MIFFKFCYLLLHVHVLGQEGHPLNSMVLQHISNFEMYGFDSFQSLILDLHILYTAYQNTKIYRYITIWEA